MSEGVSHSRVSIYNYKMATAWSMEETKALLGAWGATDVQSQLDGVTQNRVVYQKIESALSKCGYQRTWEQCKTKNKNLTQKYRNVCFFGMNHRNI